MTDDCYFSTKYQPQQLSSKWSKAFNRWFWNALIQKDFLALIPKAVLSAHWRVKRGGYHKYAWPHYSFLIRSYSCVTQSLELSQLAVVRTTNSRHHIKSIGYNIDNQHHQYQGSQPTDPLVRHLARSKNKQKEALWCLGVGCLAKETQISSTN